MLQSRSCCKGTPKAAIARNIVSVVKRAAPWLNPPQATASQLGKMRFELRTVEEYLAGRRVAAAYRVRVLGFDETTKNQEPSLSFSQQVHLGWRYAAESIARLARERTAARMP